MAFEVIDHRPKVLDWIADEWAFQQFIALVTVVRVGVHVFVMGRVVESNDVVPGLPVVRVFLFGEPDVEKSIVDEEDPQVPRGVARAALDDGVRDEGGILGERDAPYRLVRL